MTLPVWRDYLRYTEQSLSFSPFLSLSFPLCSSISVNEETIQKGKVTSLRLHYSWNWSVSFRILIEQQLMGNKWNVLNNKRMKKFLRKAPMHSWFIKWLSSIMLPRIQILSLFPANSLHLLPWYYGGSHSSRCRKQACQCLTM